MASYFCMTQMSCCSSSPILGSIRMCFGGSLLPLLSSSPLALSLFSLSLFLFPPADVVPSSSVKAIVWEYAGFKSREENVRGVSRKVRKLRRGNIVGDPSWSGVTAAKRAHTRPHLPSFPCAVGFLPLLARNLSILRSSPLTMSTRRTPNLYRNRISCANESLYAGIVHGNDP